MLTKHFIRDCPFLLSKQRPSPIKTSIQDLQLALNSFFSNNQRAQNVENCIGLIEPKILPKVLPP